MGYESANTHGHIGTRGFPCHLSVHRICVSVDDRKRTTLALLRQKNVARRNCRGVRFRVAALLHAAKRTAATATARGCVARGCISTYLPAGRRAAGFVVRPHRLSEASRRRIPAMNSPVQCTDPKLATSSTRTPSYQTTWFPRLSPLGSVSDDANNTSRRSCHWHRLWRQLSRDLRFPHPKGPRARRRTVCQHTLRPLILIGPAPLP